MVITVPYKKLRELTTLYTHRTALEFDPDRFLDERVQKYLVPNPFIFLPFNAGPRICLGQQVRIIIPLWYDRVTKFGVVSLLTMKYHL